MGLGSYKLFGKIKSRNVSRYIMSHVVGA